MIEEIKTVKLSSKRQISIPKSFKALKDGAKAIMKIENNRIIIEPIEDVKEYLDISKISQKAFEENWLSKEDEKAYGHLKSLVKNE